MRRLSATGPIGPFLSMLINSITLTASIIRAGNTRREVGSRPWHSKRSPLKWEAGAERKRDRPNLSFILYITAQLRLRRVLIRGGYLMNQLGNNEKLIVSKCPKVLIITMFSGENEILLNKKSVLEQRGVEAVQSVIEHLPNLEAHTKLYSIIMKERQNFDYFVKLDADMVLRTPNSLLKILKPFKMDPNLDHYHAPVFDHPSGFQLMGVHVFSNRVTWKFPLDALFPDPFPFIQGSRLVVKNCENPQVDHMPNPSLDQAYQFGYHRALKITQRERRRKVASHARYQLRLFELIWLQYRATKDELRAKMLTGFVDALVSLDAVMVHKKVIPLESNLSLSQSTLHGKVSSKVDAYFLPTRLKYWKIRVQYILFPKALEYIRLARVRKN